MKIAVASGKGGTGKSTVSTNLAYFLSKKIKNLALLDCDVEEPNCHIFFKPEFSYSEKTFTPVPEIDSNKCISCGKCAETCQYNALAFVKGNVFIFQELCHGCGGCKIICPANAINEKGRELGVVEAASVQRFNFIHGKSRIGEAMSPPLIKAVKEYGRKQNFELQIYDCPPGTSCPLIAAVDGADFVIMVTEPTPFGLYDLKLTVDVIRRMNLPFGLVINRSNSNDKLIEDWAKEEKIKILTKIPDNRKIAECYSRGELVLEVMPEFEKYFEPLANIIGGKKCR